MTLPSQILDAAADLIEPEGRWGQGQYARTDKGNVIGPDTPGAACWCAIGGIKRSAIDDLRQEDDARHYMRTAIGGALIDEWNDAPFRTQSEVVQALRKAADLAREEGR